MPYAGFSQDSARACSRDIMCPLLCTRAVDPKRGTLQEFWETGHPIRLPNGGE